MNERLYRLYRTQANRMAQQAFSLLELLCVISLSAMVLIGLGQGWALWHQHVLKQTQRQQAQQTSHLFLQQLQADLDAADSYPALPSPVDQLGGFCLAWVGLHQTIVRYQFDHHDETGTDQIRRIVDDGESSYTSHILGPLDAFDIHQHAYAHAGVFQGYWQVCFSYAMQDEPIVFCRTLPLLRKS